MDPTSSCTTELQNNFEGLLDCLRDPENGPAALSPQKFIEIFKIDIQTLANQAHVHRNTVRRSPTSENLQRFLRESLRVIRAGTDVSGDVKRAIFWYRNDPLPHFGYKTAEQLVSEGRSEDVIRYIESLEAGASG